MNDDAGDMNKKRRDIGRALRPFARAIVVFLAFACMSQAFAGTSKLPFALTFQVRQSTLTSSGPQAALNEIFTDAKAVGNTILFLTDWAPTDNFAGLVQNINAARAAGLNIAIGVQVNDALNRTISAPSGYAATFSDINTVRLYLNNIGALASLQPKYMVLNEEVNLLFELNHTEYLYYKNIYPYAYQVAKQVSPNTLFGVAISDTPWINDNAAEVTIPTDLGTHDLIGITSYPHNTYSTVAQIPSDYYTRWRTAYPNDTLIFAEIDWDTAGTSSPADQANFVNALPTLMQGVNPSMLAWALPFDCSCFAAANLTQEQITFFQNTYNVNLTNLFSSFNAEGMIGANGVAKPAWTAALALFGLAQSPPIPSSSQGQ